jgi:hypothetical protein
MRFVFIILFACLISTSLVYLRREQMLVRHDRQRIDTRHAELRREIWSRQVEIGHALTPAAIRDRSEAMALELTQPSPAQARADEAGDARELE